MNSSTDAESFFDKLKKTVIISALLTFTEDIPQVRCSLCDFVSELGLILFRLQSNRRRRTKKSTQKVDSFF